MKQYVAVWNDIIHMTQLDMSQYTTKLFHNTDLHDTPLHYHIT